MVACFKNSRHYKENTQSMFALEKIIVIPKKIRMKKVCCIVFAIIGLYSCKTEEPSKLSEVFKLEKKLVGEALNFEKTFGNPNQVILDDSLLLLKDRDSEYLISILDPKGERFLGRLCKIGKGPEEFNLPVEISVNNINQTLSIYERSIQRLSHLDISSKEINNIHIQKRISFANDLGYTGFVRKLSDSLYIGVGQFSKRYALFDKNGELLKTTQDYPSYDGINISDELSYIAYQNILEVNTSNRRVAAASIYCDNIEFFKLEEENLILTKRYGFLKPDFVDKSNNSHRVLHPSDTNIMGFLDIKSDENFVYCLYSGRSIKGFETMARARKGEDIFVFDWKGNPITRYSLNKEIIAFAVDSEKRIFYGISHTPEPVIIKFEF